MSRPAPFRREIENLFRVIRELRQEGRVIIYVSTAWRIFALSDAITVFKDGRYVRTFDNMQEVNHDALVQAMVGRELGDIYGWQPREYGKERLRLEQVKAPACASPSVCRCGAEKSSVCLGWSAPDAAS